MVKFILVSFVFSIAVAVAFISLGSSVLDGHEVFVSVTAREMIQNNDYLIPTFNGHYRLNKTPLPYWLVVAAEHFTGRIDEFTARMPTAILSVLSVLCILYFITILLDFRTAFLASLVWICSLSFIRYSHCARPEMALTFFMLISFLSFYAALEEVNRKRQICFSLIFWISLGLSVLAKAPSSLFFMALSAIVYLTVFKQWGKASKILPVWGFLLLLLIVLPWPIAAANAMHWDLSLWRQESINRFMEESENGHFTWLYYVPRIFQFMIPWAIFLPYAFAAPFFKVWGNKRRLLGYLWICFFTGVLFLSACSGKRPHYILPLMPPASILTGIVMEDMLFSRKAYREKERVNLLKGHIIAFLAVGAAALVSSLEPAYTYSVQLLNSGISLCTGSKIAFPIYSKSLAVCTFGIGLILIAGILSGLALYRSKKQFAACTAVFSSIALVVVLGYSCISLWPKDYTDHRAEFALRIRAIVPEHEDVFVLGHADDVLVHYFGKPFKKADESDIQRLYDTHSWLMASSEKLEHVRENYNFHEAASFEKYRDDELRKIAVFHKNDSATDELAATREKP